MSLDCIYLCCDDGEVYAVDYVEGDGWTLSLEEFRDDMLSVPAKPRRNGQPRNEPRPRQPVEKTIADAGLPIDGVRFMYNTMGKTYYAVSRWRQGVAFPRRLLPESLKPKTTRQPLTGTFVCYTKQHHKRLMQGR